MAAAATPEPRLDSESRIREIRPSGLMRGRGLTVIGYAFHSVGPGLLYHWGLGKMFAGDDAKSFTYCYLVKQVRNAIREATK
jgi:hypothetical protein